MRRKQLTVMFCVLLGWPMIEAAVRVRAEALWDDLSLIGYDDRGGDDRRDLFAPEDRSDLRRGPGGAGPRALLDRPARRRRDRRGGRPPTPQEGR